MKCLNYTGNRYTVSTARTVWEVEQLRSIWEKMQWHPFTDIDFYLTEARLRREIVRPHVMLVSQEGVPKTLLVGRIEDGHLNLQVGYKVLLKPKVRFLLVEYGGLLGDSSYSSCETLIWKLMDALGQGESDFVVFKQLPVDSCMYQLATALPNFLCRDHFPWTTVTYRLYLPDTFEDFLRGLSKSTRSGLRNHSNRLIKKYGQRLSIRRYCKRSEIDLIMRDTETIAKKTYQRVLGSPQFVNDPITRQKLEFELEHQRLRAHILYTDCNPVAFFHLSHYGDVLFEKFLGFNQEYRDDRVGTFLIMKVIEEACGDNGIKAIDFGEGDFEYKRRLCKNKWQEADVYIFAANTRGMMLNGIRSVIDGSKKGAKMVLNRFKLMGTFKRYRNERAARKIAE